MSKELVISANRHETRVALVEDEQVVEIYHQRENEYSLAGSIHKGRVSRVLPGMQSAFVDIGLDRDAFLYVSDFFEDADEYDKIVAEAEARVTRFAEVAATTSPVSVAPPAEASVAGPPPAGAPVDERPAPTPVLPTEVVTAEAPVAQEAAPQVAPVAAPPSGSFNRNNRPSGPPSDFRRG